MAGSNAAAQRGILVRDGVALEKAGKVTAVLFDKTGTLTVGKPTVAKVWQNGADFTLSLAASLARRSAHPISRAIASASASELDLTDWQEVPGAGVQGTPRGPLGSRGATTSGTAIARLGSLRWLREAGVDLSPAKAFAEDWSAQGATLVGLASERTLLGMFAVRDAVKPGAKTVVATLQKQG
jgi:Cu+-exporting ATPase